MQCIHFLIRIIYIINWIGYNNNFTAKNFCYYSTSSIFLLQKCLYNIKYNAVCSNTFLHIIYLFYFLLILLAIFALAYMHSIGFSIPNTHKNKKKKKKRITVYTLRLIKRNVFLFCFFFPFTFFEWIIIRTLQNFRLKIH